MHEVLGFLVGGRSNFLTFGGRYFVALPSDYSNGEILIVTASNVSLTMSFAHRVISWWSTARCSLLFLAVAGSIQQYVFIVPAECFWHHKCSRNSTRWTNWSLTSSEGSPGMSSSRRCFSLPFLVRCATAFCAFPCSCQDESVSMIYIVEGVATDRIL